MPYAIRYGNTLNPLRSGYFYALNNGCLYTMLERGNTMSIDNQTTKQEFLRAVFSFEEDAWMLKSLEQGKFEKTSVFVLRGKYSPFQEGGELIIFVEKDKKSSKWVGWGYQDGSAQFYPCPQAAWDDLEEMGAIHLF